MLSMISLIWRWRNGGARGFGKGIGRSIFSRRRNRRHGSGSGEEERRRRMAKNDEYKDYEEVVILTNKPVHVEPHGDIISAQLVEKHGDLYDIKKIEKKIKTLQKIADQNYQYDLVKAYKTVLKEIKEMDPAVWASSI